MASSKELIKEIAETCGVKKPMMKGDYGDELYLFAESIRAVAVAEFKQLRDKKEAERISNKGDGMISTVELTKVLNDVR